MKYLVDTCGWITWLTESSGAANFEYYLRKIDKLIVPTIIQFELYKWICREKTIDIALEILSITEQACVIPLNTELALLAGDISKAHQLAMADAIIYAAAQHSQATLVTSDKHFKTLDDIIFLEKTNR